MDKVGLADAASPACTTVACESSTELSQDFFQWYLHQQNPHAIIENKSMFIARLGLRFFSSSSFIFSAKAKLDCRIEQSPST